MGYKAHPPVVYLVGWERDRIIKAGVSSCQRWRSFCLRGATLHQILMPIKGGDVWGIERQLTAHLSGSLPWAFANRAAGAEHLGGGGDGHAECFVADSLETWGDALRTCIRIMHLHSVEQCGTDLRTLMHGRTRTNELTKTTNHQRDNLLSGDARAHIREMAVDESGGNA